MIEESNSNHPFLSFPFSQGISLKILRLAGIKSDELIEEDCTIELRWNP